METCTDCNVDESLPCEQHMVTITQREGSCSRSADELKHVFITDAVAAGVTLAPWGVSIVRELETLEAWDGSWLDPNVIDSDSVESLCNQVETELATLGIYTHWDDGFTMYQVTGGPLAEED